MKRETVIVLDFGGQYNQLNCTTRTESVMYTVKFILTRPTLEKIKAMEPKGIIFTGGPEQLL